MNSHRGQLGLPQEVWRLLDPALVDALLERRLEPEELPELVGWLADGGEFDLRVDRDDGR